MPTPLTSSFASATANTNSEGSGTRRGDGSGGNEWSRNRANGATQTFRRSSQAAGSSQSRENVPPATTASTTGVYIPPHLNANYSSGAIRNGNIGDSRYSKEQMLGIYQSQKEAGALSRNLEALFVGTWNPLDPRSTSTPTWTRKEEGREASTGPEVCWDHEARGQPLGFIEMDEEEKQIYFTSVNSPLKLPQNSAKDSSANGGLGGRKISVSGGTSASTRPGARRRETSDSFAGSGPLSPTGSKQFFRDDPSTNTPPQALLRRKTDFQDESSEATGDSRDREKDTQQRPSEPDSLFGSLKRSTTGPAVSGLNSSVASPWSSGPQTSAFGAFSNFGIGSSPATQDSAEKRSAFGSGRGGSRFKDLLSRTSAEDMSPSVKEKPSQSSLGKLPEAENENSPSRLQDIFKTRPTRSETNPYGDVLPRTGSAALGGAQDNTFANQGVEQLGFSSFGPPSNIGPRDFSQPDIVARSTFHQTPQQQRHESMSPTNTNPYHSPNGNLNFADNEESNDSNYHQDNLPPFGSVRRNVAPEDRSQSSSTAPGRGLPAPGSLGGLPGLGTSAGWPSSGLGSGTPGRERGPTSSAFGDPVFSPMSDLQSPNVGSLGGAGLFGSAGVGRTSKLGPLFPPAMQEQLRDERSRRDFGDGFEGSYDAFQTGASARDPFDSMGRRRDDPSMRSSNFFEDPSISSFGPPGHMAEDSAPQFGDSSGFPQVSSAGAQQIPLASVVASQRAHATADNTGHSGPDLSQSSGSSSSNQLPATQQRQMVMPDRMRWIYRDPQGNTQGPWSGLEMHDWFKAGFFTAELQVKKLEDAEYEPLAQLVRRIGNSREPFLVPQIGVPHGPANPAQGNHWASPTLPGTGTPQSGPAQPPFASSFPSFGTTLTAEQQNALERRKQEEQFLMARQKEHLAQHQVIMKQMQMQNGPHAMHSLQHHSSAHSLQSQPSFSSMTSPSTAYPPSQMQGSGLAAHALPNIFEGSMRQAPTSNMGSALSGSENRGPGTDDLNSLVDRMSFSQRSGYPFGLGPPGGSVPDSAVLNQSAVSMLQERARLQGEQQQADGRGHHDVFSGPRGQNDRLREFNALRTEVGTDQSLSGPTTQPIGAPSRLVAEDSSAQLPHFGGLSSVSQISAPAKPGTYQESDILSLSQQVQRAAASNQQTAAAHVESPWARVEAQLAPPVSVSPLPAPAAQRNRSNVADALAAESRSQNQTPVETPSSSLAPWAEKNTEIAKGPSLKEIQEAEARKAAHQEEIMAAARRAQAEVERLASANAPAPAPGLPLTSTWASTTSPAAPSTPATSAWAKAPTAKPSVATASASNKKTLAQIQREEESRKQRAAAAANAQTSAITSTTGGKRYAELASKISPITPAGPSGAWMTVGSSGKAKAPIPVVAGPQAAARTATSSSSAKVRPSTQPSRSTMAINPNKAVDEFSKWAKSALGNRLNNNINVDDFVQSLMILPPEVEIISDSVYANSQILDSRRFAEEFVHRRKQADKGIFDSAQNGAAGAAGKDSKNGGGWSEVAKKGPAPKEESNSAFKVVAAKKKGKR